MKIRKQTAVIGAIGVLALAGAGTGLGLVASESGGTAASVASAGCATPTSTNGGLDYTVMCSAHLPAPTPSATVSATPTPTPTSDTPTPTPTESSPPAPTDTPTGPPPANPWVTGGNNVTPPNPVTYADRCGGKSPTAACTGPTGTLTTYTGPNPVTVSGTVIRNAKFTSRLDIKADNVTIENSDLGQGFHANGRTGLTLIGVDLGGSTWFPKKTTRLIGSRSNGTGPHADALDMGFNTAGNTDTAGGYLGQDILVQDSFFGGMCPVTVKDHVDSLQFWSYGLISGLTVYHNTMDDTPRKTADCAAATDRNAALFLGNSTYSNVRIEKNMLIGGVRTLRIYSTTRPTTGPVTSVWVIGNRFDKSEYPNGLYAEISRVQPSRWEDNKTIQGAVVPVPVYQEK